MSTSIRASAEITPNKAGSRIVMRSGIKDFMVPGLYLEVCRRIYEELLQ
jgi:hypothetical protein